MPKWFKTIVALALSPLCYGAVWALWRVLQQSGNATTIWVGLLGGAACWVVIYGLLPKPMLAYVYGHELTHVLWTWLFLGKVKKFKATAKGGHVIITRSNFLIALAPYFFPLYAVMVVAVYAGGYWFLNWKPYLVWFHLLLGATYAFHVTLTWHALKIEQTDVTDHGYVFSAVIIFLGNMTVLLLAVPLLTAKVGVLTSFGWWMKGSWEAARDVVALVRGGV